MFESTRNITYKNMSYSRNRLVRLLAAAAFASMSFSTSAIASTINEPGFVETTIDSIAIATNGYGGMVTDNSGNLYFAANFANEVYIVPPGGTASQFGSIPASNAQGVAIIGTTLYSSFDGAPVYRQDLQQANPAGVLVASVTGGTFGMAVVPAGFGPYGGQLAVGTQSGISILDPSNGNVVVLWTAGTQIPDVAFTLDGRLVATRYSGGDIVEVTSGGVASTLASGFGSPDGIAVQPATGEIYITTPNSSEIWKLQPDGSAQSVFASNAQVDGGYYPSPITFSADGVDMYYATRESGSTIYQISGFDAVGVPIDPVDAVPVPVMSYTGLLALILLLATAGFISLRRWSKN